MSSVKPPEGSSPLPPELTARPQWVLWRREPAASGRPTKVLYNARTGKKASTTNPGTWSAYPEAAAALARRSGFEGLGFVFSEADDLIGVDLDHCLDADGALAPWARVIVERLASYTERSPSGRGLHIFVRGSLPPGRRKREFGKPHADGRKSAVEMYEQGRYFTVTGRHLPGTPTTITAAAAAIAQIHQEFLTDGRKPTSSTGNFGFRISDFGLKSGDQAPPQAKIQNPKSEIELLCQSPRYERLWQGDWADYGSQSEADLALCARLAQLTRGDLAAIDRLFRQSGLYRPKWDQARGSQTYGQRTIARACSSFLAPAPGPATSANGSSGDPPAPPPNLGLGMGAGPPIHATDLGNAMRLVRRHGADLRHVAVWGCWLFWDGRRWCRDETGEAKRRAKETVRAMYAEAAALPDGERQALARWAVKSEARSRLEAMLALAESEPEVARLPQTFDADPWLFNSRNGTLELPTGTLRPHRREDLITRLAPVDYDPDAPCPTFERFLQEIMGGREELIDYLQRWAGYCLTGDVSEQMLLFLHGMGANGKSTLLRLLLALFGDYATPAAPGLLLEHRSDRHPTEIAELKGKRLVVSVEVGEGKRLAEELVKQMTGGDRMKGRLMRQDFFEFDPEFKLVLAANHKPVIRGTDHAIWRRIPLVPFAVTFREDGEPKKDPHLLEKLLQERPGILAWAARGCREWQQRGLAPPARVHQASEAYRSEMDVLGSFLEDQCVQHPTVQVTAAALYAAYKHWCEATGERAITQTALGKALQERGFTAVRQHRGRGWQGVGLRAAPEA